VLHITNGDCAVEVLRKAGMKGDFLPWRDVLHEGPVDASLSLEELSERRTKFISGAGWATPDQARKSFVERDERLKSAGGDDEVVLWFEHDLYDQLQLLQLLDWFGAHPHPKLSLVCEAEYLGEMAPARAVGLFSRRKPVTQQELGLASKAWRAFGSNDPTSLGRIAAERSNVLRFLSNALRRHLEEFPWVLDGISRTERQVFDVLRAGAAPFEKIFAETQKREEPRFLGDTVLRWHLERMESEGRLRRTGEAWRMAEQNPKRRLPRWLGGVLVDERCPWRWDPALGRLVR
jgi:hypothetical protein